MDHDPPDLFICHAGDDKQDYVRPLAHALRDAGLRGWYDEFELRPGDSLRRSIDKGLSQARVAVVVLSPSFFGKKWPEHELNGIVQRYEEGRLIPIWHGVDHAEVERYSPSLADTIAIKSDQGIPSAVAQLREAVDRSVDRARAVPSTLSVDKQSEAVSETAERAQRGLETLRTRNASLVVSLASSPHVEAQRPKQFGDAALRRRMLQEAIFGRSAIFEPSAGSSDKLVGDAIVLEQPGRLICCDGFGSVVISQPAVERPSARNALPSLVQEEVEERLSTALGLSSDLLNVLDPEGAWTEVAVFAALRACDGLGWRTRTEALHNPNSISLNLRSTDAQVSARPPRLPRIDLGRRAIDLAEDLAELLRRQLQHGA